MVQNSFGESRVLANNRIGIEEPWLIINYKKNIIATDWYKEEKKAK